MNLTKQISAAKRAAQKAGKRLLDFYNHKETNIIKAKSEYDIVSSADLEAEKIYLTDLPKIFPDYNFITEEKGEIHNGHESEFWWIIDPLDGTINFSFHNPIFATSISLARFDKKTKKPEILFGITYAPVLKELYFAEKGKGAFLNNKKLQVSKKDELKKSVLTFCHGSKDIDNKRTVKAFSKFKLISRSFRQLGAASVELGYVAAGRTECIMIPGAKVWDAATGVLLVREAGGKVTDYRGKEWQIGTGDMLASNAKIHDELIKELKNI